MKNYKKLFQSDYKKILELILENKKLGDVDTDELYDKISHQYLKSLRANYKNNNLKAEELAEPASVLDVVIEILSTLTGKPQSALNESSKLNNIQLTSIKRERARQQINSYIKEQGSTKYVSSVEITKCETIKNLVDVVNQKLK